MRVLLLLGLLSLLVLIPFPSPAAAAKDWTVLVYLDGDNDLERAGILDFLEMASIGSGDRLNIVVQFDRAVGFDTQFDDWTTAKRFYVTPGMVPSAANAFADLGEVNMADPATLASFITWGITNYPARYYFLILWDHGDGWQGVVVDDDPVPGDRLTSAELRTAVGGAVTANGRRIDLLGNDACRMSIEIQYELAGYVDYFVGSEKDEPLDGWPYDSFLWALAADPSLSPAQVGSLLVDRYVASYENTSPYSVTLSVVNAAALRPLVASLNGFLDELDLHQPYFTAEVISAKEATERYEIGGLAGGLEYDLYHFVENLLERIPSRRLERRGMDLLGAISAAVVYERHWDNPNAINGVSAKDAHGISLWFPASGGDPGYEALRFSADGRWDEFLRTYTLGSRPQVVANVGAVAVDTTGDSYFDKIVLTFEPAVDGTMAVDLYREGLYVLSRDYTVMANRAEEVRFPFAIGGLYEVTFYLFNGTDLVNLTIARDLVVHELIPFRGIVTGADGKPFTGASVTLVHLASGRRMNATTSDSGVYRLLVPYPTWFRDGDGVALEVHAGELETRITFNATIPPERAFNRDVFLNTADLTLYRLAIALLLFLTISALALAIYYWQRFRRFKAIP
ncbi:MAG: hypothetical protein HY557_08040 [Euryarchaeota archaeon]|nr:hypothetical protein [Euryarchaeota archaeon]